MKVCGPKYALCGLIISAWGIIQLFLMGAFFFINSVALIEDVSLKERYNTKEEFFFDVNKGFKDNAINCWIAACIYVVTFFFSGHQFYLNSRSSLAV